MNILEKIGAVWKRVMRPSLLSAKPVIREFAKKELIPELQKRINAGRWDKQADRIIAKTILEVIDEI